MAKQTPNLDLASEHTEKILALRLLIARAANKDSLAWWDDDSLTPHAGYLLERLFPMAPTQAAHKLALTAALGRHNAALADYPNALHLYHLDPDNRDTLALRFEPLLLIQLPEESTTTMARLREQLAGLILEPPGYEVIRQTPGGGLQIKCLRPPGETSVVLHRARSLAWAYLEGAPGQPVFPFTLE